LRGKGKLRKLVKLVEKRNHKKMQAERDGGRENKDCKKQNGQLETEDENIDAEFSEKRK
jgi:hypothetical protein